VCIVRSLNEHVKKCKWRKFGYSKNEVNAILDDEASLCKGSMIWIGDIDLPNFNLTMCMRYT